MWQPEMERELGGFCESTQKNESKGNRVQGVGLNLIASGEHIIQFKAANNITDKQYACQQRESTTAGYGKRHPGTASSVLFVSPETDQQEGCETGELPENEHQQQVAGQNDAQHRAFETQEQRVKFGYILFGFEVVVGINNDQETDEQYQQRKQKRQAIKTKTEREAESRQPLVAVQNGAARRKNRPVWK